MIKRIVIGVAVALVLAVAALAFLSARLLSGWGLTLAQTLELHHALEADAAALRDAEAPIDTPNGIAERGFVKIGGIDQWITIRGEDRNNPAILILHGGPGDAQSQLAYLYRHWEKDFTVVQWDQRGAGRTFGRNGKSTPDMSVNQLIEDGAEVADYARKRLGQQKIILVGHSWGSALGVMLVKRHPELFSAYVGTGQIGDWPKQTAWEYAYTLQRLTADRRAAVVAELAKLGPPPYASDAQEEVMRKWLNRYLAKSDRIYLLTSIAVMLRNADYSLKDFGDLQTGHLSFSIPALYAQVTRIDLNTLGYDVPMPFFIIDGREDRITPPDLVAEYFQKIRAPQKEMMLIDGGHFAMMSNADAFLKILLERVRPAALAETTEPAAPATP
jgi:proline iminopeptidase